MAAIGDVMWKLAIESAGLAAEMERTVGRAADKAGPSIGKRLSGALASGIGAGAGLLFGVAAKGGLELTEAMGRFRAETGATQAEVESATKSVVELSRSNLQAFDEIARAQAALRTDLGLTQAEAEAATQAFLDYGTATGRDAAEGVTALDDILDAWNLDASDSSRITDLLVASHQKYGGSLTDNEKALATLAPQLQALGQDEEDGIALLNLFAASGLDSAKAAFALNTAVRKLKPGESLDDLIAQVSSIEDPTLRAQKAIEIFGAKGGVSLANVLRPGIDSLDDFAISAEEAGGTVQEAAEAIEATPFNQLKLALKGIAGPLAEVGQNFGPLLLGFSSLGGGKVLAAAAAGLGGFGHLVLPKLAAGLAGLLPALAGGLATLGSGIGAAISAAIPIGMAALPVILIGALVAAIGAFILVPEFREAVLDIGRAIVDGIAKGLGAIGGVLGKIVGFVADMGKRALGATLGFVAEFVRLFLSIPGRVIGFVAGVLGHVASLGMQIVGKVAGIVGDIVRWFLSIPGRLVGLGGQIVSAIISGFASLPGRLATAIRNAFLNLRIDVGPFHISGRTGITIDLPKIDIQSGGTSGQFGPRTATQKRQHGGPVTAGDPFLVGERGPELFVPRVSGTVTPNMDLRELAGQTVINNNVRVDGFVAARDQYEILEEMRRFSALGVFSPTKTQLVVGGRQ